MCLIENSDHFTALKVYGGPRSPFILAYISAYASDDFSRLTISRQRQESAKIIHSKSRGLKSNDGNDDTSIHNDNWIHFIDSEKGVLHIDAICMIHFL